MLSRGDALSWVIGAPAVVTALAAYFFLPPVGRWRLSARGAARFLAYFPLHSLMAGIDLAWRALARSMPLNPRLHRYRLFLPEGPAQIFFANTVSLMPGTLSAELEEGWLTVHMLSDEPVVFTGLEKLERMVAGLFAVPIPPPGPRVEEPLTVSGDDHV